MLKTRLQFIAITLLLGGTALAQAPAKGAACEPEKALALIAEQLEANNMLDPLSKRVALYVQGADLLWKHRPDAARAAFQAAYDWAGEAEDAKPAAAKSDSRNRAASHGDLRLDVIRAIAKYDTAWSRSLMEKLLAAKTEQAEKNALASNEGVLYQAEQLLASDQDSAIKLARHSLASAPALEVASFLVSLGKRDSRAADALYLEALAVISKRSVNDTMMLYTYPFASERPIGVEWRSSGIFQAKELTPNPALQARFIEVLFQLAAQHAELPMVTNAPPDGPYKLSPAARLYIALGDLEPVAAARFAPLHGRLLQLKQRLGDLIAEEYQKTVQSVLKTKAESGAPFNRNLSEAERANYPGGADKYYFDAIQRGLETEPREQLEAWLEKIFDSTTRKQMADWLYFSLGRKAIAGGRLDEAARLADKVGPLDLRAYLAFQIAEAALNKSKDNPRAAESLDAAWRMAQDAGDTNEKAKALLGIASLYLRLDAAQAMNALRAAANTINRIAEPDVSTGQFSQTIRGKGFAAFMSFGVPGMSLGNAFREAGKADYDAALSAAFGLDKPGLRAESVFALSAFCLASPPSSPGKKKNN
jgi:hypothetical protein